MCIRDRARDQTRLLCEFGANLFSVSRDISYTNKKPQTDGAKKGTFRSSLSVVKTTTANDTRTKLSELKQKNAKCKTKNSLVHGSRARLYRHWCSLKPRLHDTTCCQPVVQPGLTAGCIVYTAGCQTGCTARFDNRLNEQLFVQHGCQTGLTTGCIV